MRRKTLLIIGLFVLPLALYFGHRGHSWHPAQWKLQARLEQLEEREGWRVLVFHLGIYYLDIRTESLVPLYVLPESQSNGSYVGLGSFSPDGTKITFGQNWGNERALMVYDLSEHRNHVLLTMPNLDQALWSPTGDTIAFAGRASGTGSLCLYIFRVSDKKLSQVVDSSSEPGVSGGFSWGPGGKSIVYQDGENNIWITDLDKKTREKVDRGWYPTWSPDGRFVAYGVADDPYHKGFVIYDLKTRKKESILAGKLATWGLVWSPDSRYLVHTRVGQGLLDHVNALMGETRFGDVYVIDLQTKAEVRVYSGNSVYPTDWGKTGALR